MNHSECWVQTFQRVHIASSDRDAYSKAERASSPSSTSDSPAVGHRHGGSELHLSWWISTVSLSPHKNTRPRVHYCSVVYVSCLLLDENAC